jgi:hypothetical protein
VSTCLTSSVHPPNRSFPPASSGIVLKITESMKVHLYSQRLTRSALLDLFRCNRKNTKDLHQNVHGDIHHFGRRWHLGVGFKTSEKFLYALEEVDEGVLAGANILGRLGDGGFQWRARKGVTRILRTRKRTPTPAKITLAGENACQENMRVFIFANSCDEAYETNTLSEGSRKGKKDIDCWLEPP